MGNGEESRTTDFRKDEIIRINKGSTLSMPLSPDNNESDKLEVHQKGNSNNSCITDSSTAIEIIPIEKKVVIPRPHKKVNVGKVKPFTLTVCDEQGPGRICTLNLDGTRAKVPRVQPRHGPSLSKVPVRVLGKRGVAVRADNVPKITVQRATVVNIPLVEKVAIREIPSSG